MAVAFNENEQLAFCITNLKIISEIQPYDKISKSEELLVIHKSSLLLPLSRWINGETRNTTMEYIDSIYSSTFTLIDSIFTNKDCPDTSTPFPEDHKETLISLLGEIKNSIKGLSNLKRTYEDDISICSRLEYLIEKTNDRIRRIKSTL